ncbi:Uncharacterized protein HZ326_14565 [Fusarium oxysporum f. sp. albedinis]|nr:Uncharacterized protein HZ326_14565 [Fusarium oxysporum f. sp. albedinis]
MDPKSLEWGAVTLFCVSWMGGITYRGCLLVWLLETGTGTRYPCGLYHQYLTPHPSKTEIDRDLGAVYGVPRSCQFPDD